MVVVTKVLGNKLGGGNPMLIYQQYFTVCDTDSNKKLTSYDLTSSDEREPDPIESSIKNVIWTRGFYVMFVYTIFILTVEVFARHAAPHHKNRVRDETTQIAKAYKCQCIGGKNNNSGFGSISLPSPEIHRLLVIIIYHRVVH